MRWLAFDTDKRLVEDDEMAVAQGESLTTHPLGDTDRSSHSEVAES